MSDDLTGRDEVAPGVLVVADDLTGANATGARYAMRGLRTVTVRHPEHLAGFRGRFDVLVINTGSRHLPASEAAGRVREAVSAVGRAGLVVKRVDTTLRGNVGAEAQAALEAVAEQVAGEVRALVVPAWPESGRTTVGGLHLVDGVPLAETEVARDPLSPVRSSRIADILHDQVGLAVTEVTLDVIEDDTRLEEALAADTPFLVCDALDGSHFRRVAAAAADRTRTDGTTWVVVDSGPFGVELVSALDLPTLGPTGAATAFVVAGSTTSVTRRQLEATQRSVGARYVRLDVVEPDLDRVRAHLQGLLEEADVVGVRTAADESDVVELDAETAARIPRMLGELTAWALETGGVGGLYITGGDIVAGVVDAVGADGIEIEAEVLPLAVAGRLIGGPHDGTPVVSKGGLIGADDAAVSCIQHLLGAIRSRTRTVEAAGRCDASAPRATNGG